MFRVSKLTATTLKRLIAEERQKLLKEGVKLDAPKKQKKVLSESQKIKLAIMLKKIEQKKLNEAKKVKLLKNKLKRSILKEL